MPKKLKDYMHCVLLEITKILLTLWTDKTYSANPWYLGPEKLKKLEERYLAIKPRNVITRTPRRLLENLAHFKASELRAFLLHFYLFKVIECHLPGSHCYADDTQLYVSFRPDNANAHEAIRAMEDCIEDIRNWLIEGWLLLNDDKTEFLVIGTRQQLNKLSPSVLHVRDHTIDSSVNVRNLGTIFDNAIGMDSHINQVCKTAFYHIHNIRRISKYLSQESLKTLVSCFCYVQNRLL